MEVFIVRPFGIKNLAKRDKSTERIAKEIRFDFDKVEAELILPALQKANLVGGTTGEIFESGDIREDMFSMLLLADIVIADITIHNANVFYELGIRHALRDKKTILIKCPGFDETPFDILGYRYVKYIKDDPSASLSDLTETIRETLLSNRKDSPVFNMLPKLDPQDPEKLMVVPVDFIEEAEIAFGSEQLGMLSLLAIEVESFQWRLPALRIIGEMLFKMKANENGRIIWEKILKSNTDDMDANDRLATIYQRLAEREMASDPDEAMEFLSRSDRSIEKLINAISIKNRDKTAEAFSLKARNEKSRWLQLWRRLPSSEWSAGALKSPSLMNAYEYYLKAYYEDLNHFYSGINALGLLTVIICLAEANSTIWELLYETKEKAEQKLNDLKEHFQYLAKCIKVSIDAKRTKLLATGDKDPWLNITEADLFCLTSNNPARVATMYAKALEGVNPLNMEATIRQLRIYEQLNVATANIRSALEVLPHILISPQHEQECYLLFTGHMIDKTGRNEPRFPASKEKIVRQKLKAEIEKVNTFANGKLLGIAGGACGGDILFHEVCKELGIATELYLALPRELFLAESVEFAGVEWVERFDRLYRKMPTHVLSQTNELPKWLQKKENYTIWERNNMWELNCALINGGINMYLIALWDGKGGDGPGGTADMVRKAKTRGAKTIIINPNDLF